MHKAAWAVPAPAPSGLLSPLAVETHRKRPSGHAPPFLAHSSFGVDPAEATINPVSPGLLLAASGDQANSNTQLPLRPIAAPHPDRVRPLVLQKHKGICKVEMQAQRGGCLQKR